MDITIILKAIFEGVSLAGIPLLAFTLGLVEWIKGFGLKGTAVRLLSMGVGLLLGTGYQFTVSPPLDFSAWFSTVVFGLGLGLVASGVYDAFNKK